MYATKPRDVAGYGKQKGPGETPGPV